MERGGLMGAMKTPNTLPVCGVKLYIHCPFATKISFFLSYLWTTMIARQVLKKVAA
jgi:hypothetical protein